MKRDIFRKRVLALVLAMVCATGMFTACDQKENNVGYINVNAPLTEQTKTLYNLTGENTIKLAFFKGVSDVPMIDVDSAVALLNAYLKTNKDASYLITSAETNGEITLTRENGATCVIRCDEGTIFFKDFNLFNKLSYKSGSLDILSVKGFNADGDAEYFKRVLCTEKAGNSSLIDLHARKIPTAKQNGKGYITLQTFSDLFLTPHEIMLAYNSESVFLLDSNLLGAQPENYYKNNVGTRSKALIDVTYNQLCLTLDFYYGLSKEHHITTADEYLSQIGLKSGLNSEDATVAFSAMKTLVYKYLSDNHSGILMHSPYNSSPNYSLGSDEASIGYWEFYQKFQWYNAKRNQQVQEGLKGYTEIGNTAFVTFNNFSSATVNYYENSPKTGNYNDEVGLISYAHAQIMREGSPIENVVVDLATNTGGHMDGGVYLTAWVLGNAIMHITDPVRNAESTAIYRADVNLDRVFDEKDTIVDKQVFLVTSPITFSCANYVAYALQESGKVTLIGKPSGGGTSCVYMSSTADGGAFCYSSPLCMSGYKNGSYYNIDRGVVPDVSITDVNDFFNYTKLAEMINAL